MRPTAPSLIKARAQPPHIALTGAVSCADQAARPRTRSRPLTALQDHRLRRQRVSILRESNLTCAEIRVNANQTAVETDGVKHSMNPFCEIAVEEAVRLREKHKEAIEDISVVTIGPSKATDVLRTALALGADNAFHIATADSDPMPEPLAIAKLLKALVDQEKPDLVILGKQAIDGDNSQTGAMLAGLLNWPIANFASKVDLAGNELSVAREIDGGLETLKMDLPAVVTTDLRLNEPRLAKLPNIMKARKKPIKTLKPADLGVDVKPRLETLKVANPPERVGGGKAESVEDLVAQLKAKGVLG